MERRLLQTEVKIGILTETSEVLGIPVSIWHKAFTAGFKAKLDENEARRRQITPAPLPSSTVPRPIVRKQRLG